ncbi:hypothetical protein INT47_002730 [Mucor saturninus]|uniref:Uncharacterized protein n=1 Tax=Mucor saturninus TaxID=64648 RepID=A0A8H7QQ97_9FUNG|nr:hypothetical protein INT47_002730 [Mucor saturninus]
MSPLLANKQITYKVALAVVPKVVEAQETNNIIGYNVINLLNASESMGVVVDDVTYPMSLNSTNGTDILYSGDAPVAKSNYKYVRFFSNQSSVTEPFDRQPSTEDTPNEFFNRTWNTYDVSRLPIIYPPLPAIHRITTELHKPGQIPTIHIVGNQTMMDEMHQNSTEDFTVVTNASYVGLHDVFSFQKAELSLAGRSSRWLPKLSYNLKFSGKDMLYSNSRIKLRSMDTDPSYIREQLAYDMVNCTGLASSGFSFIRVFMNDHELGLFGIIETFHDNWVADTFGGGDPKYKNGYLYQGVFQTPASAAVNLTADLRYVDNITTYGLGQYQIKESAAKGKSVNWKPLQELTKFIANAPTNTPDAVNEWNKHLDTASVLRG